MSLEVFIYIWFVRLLLRLLFCFLLQTAYKRKAQESEYGGKLNNMLSFGTGTFFLSLFVLGA